MIRDHSHRENRSAFTLVELLVVILIIAILVSLLSSAVMKALGKIPEVQTSTEIAELGVALQAFMMDYNLTDPPPSMLFLNEYVGPGAYAPGDPSYAFLQKVFGKNLIGTGPTGVPPYWVDWNGDGTQDGPLGVGPTAGPWPLQGQQCLVFYLGGIPNTAAVASGMPPAPQGFSVNSMNPALITPGSRTKGPYFPFVTTRLVRVLGGFGFAYLDPWQTKTAPLFPILGGTPYVYFSSNGNNNGYSIMDCSGVAPAGSPALPYWTAQTLTVPPVPTQYTNSNGYQIISAGKDGKFGYNPAFLPLPNNLWSPISGAIGTGADDQSNFSSTLLGVGQN